MRIKNAIIYFIITLMLLPATVGGVAAADTDISAETGLLYALGIIDGEAKSITRGDFAEIMIKAMNMGGYISDAPELSFLDVDKAHSKYGYIAAAKMYGVMSGYSDVRFSPDKAITVGEAIGVVVNAIGDERVKNGMSDYDSARKHKLLKNMKGVTGEPLAYDQMVILIYNFLHAKLLRPAVFSEERYQLKEGGTVLNTYFDMEQLDGIVNADAYTAIKGRPMKEDFVTIGDTVLFDEKGLAVDMIGCRVMCYYKDDAEKEIVYVCVNRKSRIEILPPEETKIEKASLKYDDESYRYNAQTTFIYNSETVTDPLVLNAAFSGSGMVKLIDHDGDDIFDTVIIEQYTVDEIESINTYTKIIKLKHADSATVYDDYRSCVFRQNNGAMLLAENLSVGSVVCAAFPMTKNGALKIISCESVGAAKISSVDYEGKRISTDEGLQYHALLNDMGVVTAGEEYDLYLDRFGSLVYAAKGENLRNFGYIINASVKNSISDAFQVKILDNDKSIQLFEQEEKIRFRCSDGTFKKLKGVELLRELRDANGGYIRQPVLYRLRADGKLGELWMLSNNIYDEFHTLDSLLDDLSESEKKALYYRSGSRNIGGKFQLAEKGLLYRVPERSYPIDDEKSQLDVMGAYSYLVSGTSFDSASDGSTKITGIAFGKNNFVSDVLILEEIPNKNTEFGPAATQPFLVTDIRYAQDEEDETCYKVTGYGPGGAETTFTYYDYDNSGFVGVANAKRSTLEMELDKAIYAPISKGDIIKYNNRKQRINKNQIEIYYRNDLDNDGNSDEVSFQNLVQHQNTYSTYRFYDSARVTPATVLAKQDNKYILCEVCDIKNSDLDLLPEDKTRTEVYNISSILVYIYSKSRNAVRRMSCDIVGEGDQFVLVTASGVAQFAVYYE